MSNKKLDGNSFMVMFSGSRRTSHCWLQPLEVAHSLLSRKYGIAWLVAMFTIGYVIVKTQY